MTFSYLFEDSDEVNSVYARPNLVDHQVVDSAIVFSRELVLFPGDTMGLRFPIMENVEDDLVRSLQAHLKGINDSTLCLAYISSTPDYVDRCQRGVAAMRETLEGAGSSESPITPWWAVGVFLEVLEIAERDDQVILTVKAYRRCAVERVLAFSRFMGLTSADLKVLPEHLGQSSGASRVSVDRAKGRSSSSIPTFASQNFSLHGQIETVLRELSAVCDEERHEQITTLSRRDPLAFCWHVCKNHYALGQLARQRLLSESSCLARMIKCASALKQAKTNVLACSDCGAPIARHAAIFSLEGTDGICGNYVNPHGHIHQTMTVRAVYSPVCISLQGRPEAKDSWFPGYAWSIMQCIHCRRHLGWRFTRSDSHPPNLLGEGAFDGNLRGVNVNVDDRATDQLQYWYWRSLLALAEEAGDEPGDVISTADWRDNQGNSRGVVWPPIEGYTTSHPLAEPHPAFNARQASDQPLVFYGLTSDGCVRRPCQQDDINRRYGMGAKTMPQLRRMFSGSLLDNTLRTLLTELRGTDPYSEDYQMFMNMMGMMGEDEEGEEEEFYDTEEEIVLD